MIDLNKCKAKFNPTQLKIGRKIEMEHTKSTKVATRIAKQHLCESGKYYIELRKMERRLKIK